METIEEYRVGRNYIRVGDRVQVLPSQPRKKDGFVSTVKRIHGTAGTPTAVEVTDPRTGATRTLRPERIERKVQTKAGKAIEVAKAPSVKPRPHLAGRR